MHYSKEEKAMWLEDWKQSGKSALAYAKENGLNPQTFVRWVKPKTENKACFVEVPVQVMSSLQGAQEILIEKGDVKIHLPLSLESRDFRTIFSALAGVV